MARFRGRADDAGPDDPVPAPSKLVEMVQYALEENHVPQEVADRVVKLLEEYEACPAPAVPDFVCPLCGSGTPEGCMCGIG